MIGKIQPVMKKWKMKPYLWLIWTVICNTKKLSKILKIGIFHENIKYSQILNNIKNFRQI